MLECGGLHAQLAKHLVVVVVCLRLDTSHARLPSWAVVVLFCAPRRDVAGFVVHSVAKLIIYPEREVRFSIDLNHE